jgi:hypothetical protein
VNAQRAIMAATLLLAACGGEPRSPRKEPLARLPAGFLPGSAAVSHDRAHHTILVRESKGMRVVRDGVAGALYRDATNRSFAPRATRHFYWALDHDEQRYLVVDDTPYPIEYSRHEYVVFDPTGAHWAMLAVGGEPPGAIVVADGEMEGPFPDGSVPAWSPSGTLAYLRARGDAAERRIELVVGDGVRRTAAGGAATCRPALGEPLQGPEMARHAGVRFLADGRLLSLMPDGGRWSLRRDDEVLATFDASVPTAPGSVGPYVIGGPDACAEGSVIAATSLTTAEAVPVAAWWERTAGPDGRWRVVVDGHPASDAQCLRPWPHQPPQLSADGRSVAFPCVERFDHRGEAIVVVHDGVRHGPYPEVWALALSDDGKRIAYGASDGSLDAGWAVFADGVQQSARTYAIWRPRFDAAGAHLAWEAMRSPSGPSDLVLDGRRLASFDDLVDGPLFDRPGEVAWIVRRKNRLARLNFLLARG